MTKVLGNKYKMDFGFKEHKSQLENVYTAILSGDKLLHYDLITIKK